MRRQAFVPGLITLPTMEKEEGKHTPGADELGHCLIRPHVHCPTIDVSPKIVHEYPMSGSYVILLLGTPPQDWLKK